MEQIHIKVGKNLQRIRKARGLTLDKVAELTGVSKAMVGQIERGDSNPTISVLWKIVNGLRISFTSLMDSEPSKVSVISTSQFEPFLERDGQYRVFPFFPYDQTKRFEIYHVEMLPHTTHESEPHNEGVEEYIIVVDGTLELAVEGETYTAEKGNAIHFLANSPHVYRNSTSFTTQYITLIYYPESNS
jgi:transcriptional regulator with XRE-family HTH domain